MKIDAQSLKKGIFEHGEKVAFGIMVVVFLAFTTFAIRREVLDDSKQPEKLIAKASEVSTHITSSKFDKDRENLKVTDFDKRAKREPLAVPTFAITLPWNPPLADRKITRDDPQVFPI